MEYFILQNGSDTSDCGGSVASACASLQQVLNRYYAEPPTMGLQITTDKSIVVDKNGMVSAFCFIFCFLYWNINVIKM